MSERTITESQLEGILSTVKLLGTHVGNTVKTMAFPPLFVPKGGEVIVVSDFKDFENAKVRVFSHINVHNGKYECFSDGFLELDNTVPWIFAKPQTPTQKGE
jgi:hypothetical protein